MSFKVLITDKIESVCADVFAKASFLAEEKPTLPAKDVEAIIGGYDALVVRSATEVTEAILKKGTEGALKIVGRAGAGVDNIDLAAAKRLGVEVINTPGVNANAVAELVISYLIILSRKLWPALDSLKAGKWDKKSLTGFEIKGKTIGLIGLGAVGRLTAAKAKALGLKVLGYDPYFSADSAETLGVKKAELSEIFSQSDFISLHLPKTPETTNLVNQTTLALMKKSAFLINCARGGLVDEKALYVALKEGHLAGAAADVFEEEPPGPSPLLELPNFVASPHIGASTVEAQLGVAIKAAELIVEYLTKGSFTS
ncbi:MAG: hydroxyacid dehydrogenase [Deltaproteobacteria bacterium]|jgi:D-3-phosphoglycerate dehydrogenase|nr:hydroxyacid dehydrogenase [Deltaproteobacteria bacterium]